MTMTDEKKTCTNCGNDEFLKGVQQYQGQLFSEKGVFTNGSSITHVFCSQCGLITQSFVNKPKKFRD